MKYSRYPAYRESGDEWIGVIPDHWMCQQLKHVVAVPVTDGPHVTPELIADGIPFLSAEAVKNNKLDFSKKRGFIDPAVHQEFARKCQPVRNDVLMVKSGNTTGAIAWVNTDEVFSIWSPLALIRASRELMSPRYLFYYTNGAPFQISISLACSYGTQPNIGMGMIERQPVTVPPIEEQIIIATFLDRETSQIDTLIAKQERLIALLQEKRQALISHVVTKGLNPAAPMKESGVAWLGEVPGHWEVAAVGYRFDVQLGKMLDEKKISGNNLAPYVKNVDVQWDRINTLELPEMDFSPDERIRYGLMPGDLLVCEGGEVGRTAIWQGQLGECYYQKAIHRVRPKDRNRDVSRFMLYLMMAAASWGLFVATGNPNTIDHLTAEKLRAHRFPFPSTDEQSRIVDCLDKNIAAIDRLVSQCRRSITLLQERRSSLISAAVTGKIDVRTLVN